MEFGESKNQVHPTQLPDLGTLGEVIRERRKTLGLTQSTLADRLGWAQERVSLLETGKYGLPSLPLLAHLAESLELPIRALMEAVGFNLEGDEANGLSATLQGMRPLEGAEPAAGRAADKLAQDAEDQVAVVASRIDALLQRLNVSGNERDAGDAAEIRALVERLARTIDDLREARSSARD